MLRRRHPPKAHDMAPCRCRRAKNALANMYHVYSHGRAIVLCLTGVPVSAVNPTLYYRGKRCRPREMFLSRAEQFFNQNRIRCIAHSRAP